MDAVTKFYGRFNRRDGQRLRRLSRASRITASQQNRVSIGNKHDS